MRKLEKPTDTAEATFTDCISKVRKAATKLALENAKIAVVTASNTYEGKASTTDLHTMPKPTLSTNLEEELVKTYNNRMAQSSSPGRLIYDRIKNLAPHNRCPMCGHRIVKTLDHVLPKAHYPLLAVAPINLIPCCRDCNTEKLDIPPTCPSDQFFHPYFDDFNDGIWLAARFVGDNEITPEFYVTHPDEWDQVKFERACFHFKKLELNLLYALNSADELMGNMQSFEATYAVCAAEGLRDDFHRRAVSHERNYLNSWQAALYRAAANDANFCDGGFTKLSAS
jgi:hypothetical protein